jgi:hypothetical protein
MKKLPNILRSNYKIKLLFFFYLLMCSIGGIYAQTTHYVKPVAEGIGDGSSWGNASGDLQEIINISVAGDTIFVAKGVYKPNRRANDVATITPNDKHNAFVPKSDVNIYGGFDPENGISELTHTRIFPNVGSGSILSGDFDDNDIITGEGSTLSFTNNSENAYRVVIFSDVTNTIFDGFAITGANCTAGSGTSVGGNSIPGGDAGGMMIAASTPIISNVAIFHNHATYGGGIYVGGNTSAPQITNAVVFKNNASTGGGGIMNYGGISPIYTNITVVQNRSHGIQNLWVGSVDIRNSIIWANGSGIANTGTSATVNYSIVQSGYSGTGNLNANPLFNNINVNNYTLSNNSPAINSGNNAVVSSTTDLVGNPRICGGVVDRGAYENPDFIPNVEVLGIITGGCKVTSLTPPTVTLNCLGTVITGVHDVSLPITESTTITWTYEDGKGNTFTQTQNVVIEDITAPIADVAALTDVTADCEITSLIAPTATDNCSGIITGTHDATLPITTSMTITWTYEDNNGNISTQTQNVVIEDVTAPIADVATLTDVTADCEVNSLIAPTATDNCSGIITGTHDATLPITTSTTITWTYEDNNGNISTQTQNIVIDEDTIIPIADVINLPDVTANCEVNSLIAPTATDNCAGTITGTHNTTFPITASTTITWTYDDGNGNTSTQTQNIVIEDTIVPIADVINLPDVTADCEVNSLIVPTATDNCVGTITGTHNATWPITKSTIITWTYEDGNGNTSTQTQNVVIEDTIVPVADAATLADITEECEVTTLTAPTATDNCSGTIAATHDKTLPITETTTITWTYEDGNGNTSTQTQEVIIDDVTEPVADEVTLADITAECEVTTLTEPTATDNCSGTITATHNKTLPISESTTITWTYDDGNGNTSSQTQNVVIGINKGVTETGSLTLTANEAGATYQWIDCDNANQPITGETNQSFTATESGNYAVEITVNGCTDTSACTSLNAVGIENITESNGWNIHPNPNQGVFTVTSNKQLENTLLEVYSPDGRLVYSTIYSGTEMSINLQDQSRGVYILKVDNKNTFRVIKN